MGSRMSSDEEELSSDEDANPFALNARAILTSSRYTSPGE
jgi:hypothetical protein